MCMVRVAGQKRLRAVLWAPKQRAGAYLRCASAHVTAKRKLSMRILLGSESTRSLAALSHRSLVARLTAHRCDAERS